MEYILLYRLCVLKEGKTFYDNHYLLSLKTSLNLHFSAKLNPFFHDFSRLIQITFCYEPMVFEIFSQILVVIYMDNDQYEFNEP